MIRGGSVLLLILFCFLGNAQDSTEFRSPLGIPLHLSGTFAELRSNHFHGGLDIKTNGKTGYRVYATQRGYVSRIKVQAGGYGNALYINHPNGYTTVYGHLDKFNDVLAKYVKQQQYQQQSFGVDLYLDANQFRVEQGEIIGMSGNSGSSGGPHLHYEIRKTAGQIPINPLEYTAVRDNINPTIKGVRVHEMSQGFYHGKTYTEAAQYIQPGKYRISGDTIVVNDPVIAVSIKAIDKQNGSNNSNGFHDLKLFVDGQLTYNYTKTEVAFDESRYINSHIDYPGKKAGLGSYSNAFKLPGNRLKFLSNAPDGRIWLSQYTKRNIQLEVCDFEGNTSTIQFVVKYQPPTEPMMANTYSQHFPYNQPNAFSTTGLRLSIPNGALYDNLKFNYEAVNTPPAIKQPIYSSIHQVHYDEVPLHKLMSIGVEATTLPAELRSKALVASLDQRNRINVNKGTWEGNYLVAKTRSFGKFFITTDTAAPTITPYRQAKAKNYAGRESIQFKIADDLSGIKTYRGTVNGQWILMEYDAKRNLLYHKFDGKIPSGENTIRLTVVDVVGNTKELEYTFTR
ncbi:MAG: M23 family metallopeptidase [Saprospiraceae bacterium]|nr:M23 family metallopeptidase [Saprospiraceae bacterium]